MEIKSNRGTNVLIRQINKAPPIFDNPIDEVATLTVDFAAYGATFEYPDKPETFKIHIELFFSLNPDTPDLAELYITPNIQTSKFIAFSDEVIEEVRDLAYKLQEFYIIHFFENNPKDVVYNAIVDAVKACNNPIYSIFYYERDLFVNIAGKKFMFPYPHKQ
jgi:hypothetical protein